LGGSEPQKPAMNTATKEFTFVRWASLLWLLVWLPCNVWVWGWQNMMHLCDIGLVLACLGMWWRLPLLVSSQALTALLVGALWGLDILWRLVLGHHLIGGTEYMWDVHYPLWIRLQSTFHLVLPAILLWTLRILGYDRRALALQSVIAGALLIFSRCLSPELNMNYAFQDPLFHRAWGPPPVHLAVILVGCVVIFLWPTHLILSRLYPATPRPAN